MDTFIYLGKLALALILGMGSGRLACTKRYARPAALAQSALVWMLLFFMGVNTGSIEGITAQFGTIGLTALTLTLLGVSGTVVLSLLASLVFLPVKKGESIAIAKRKEGSSLRHVWDVIKEPLLLVCIVVFGLVMRLNTPLFGWFRSSFISYLLYGLLFFIGMGMIHKDISFKGMLSDKSVLLLPLYCVLGTYLGALFAPLVTPFSLGEAMGMMSGFGWYSLSGVLISSLGFPLLGSISFLTNLLRESVSFFLIPLFGRLGKRYYYPAVCTAGATSMDVTLVLLTSHFGTRTILASVYHGVIISLLGPLLIPLFF